MWLMKGAAERSESSWKRRKCRQADGAQKLKKESSLFVVDSSEGCCCSFAVILYLFALL